MKRSDKQIEVLNSRQQVLSSIDTSLDRSGFIDKDDTRLLDKLKANIDGQSFDSDHMTSVMRDLLGNCANKKTSDYLPRDRIKHKKDGRHYLKIDEVKIYYDESDISSIINFTMRNRLHVT